MNFKRMILSLFFLALFLALVPPPTLAQTQNEGTVAASQEEKIKDLKERVATKVAQMRTLVYKALLGEIQSVAKDSFVLKARQGEKKILVSEETKIFRFSRGRKTAVSLSDFNTQERAAVVGSTDAEGEFVAKLVLVKSLPLNINGLIEGVDQKNFTITVKNNQKGVSYLVDIEAVTKVRLWKKGEGFEKSGFSKLQVSDRVHINGLRVPQEENRLSAVRILVLPGEAVGITGAEPTVTPTQGPTPTSQASPTPTPKKIPTPTSTP